MCVLVCCAQRTRVCVHVLAEARGNPWAFSVTFCLIPLRRTLSQNLELGQTTPAIPVCAPPASNGVTGGCWNPDSGPGACTVKCSPTEPSLQPRFLTFIRELLPHSVINKHIATTLHRAALQSPTLAKNQGPLLQSLMEPCSSLHLHFFLSAVSGQRHLSTAIPSTTSPVP